MERISFLGHQGKQILYHNFSKATPEDWEPVIENSKQIIKNQKTHSVLSLTDVTDAMVDEKVQNQISDWLKFNKNFIKASAIVGVTGFRKFVLNTVTKIAGRKINVFDSLEEAKDWLVKQ